MISLLVDIQAVTASHQVRFTARGDCPERLLIECLRELLHLEADEELVPVQFAVVQLSADELGAECQAAVAPLDAARPHLLGEIKAVTYHDLNIEPTAAGLEVKVVFDV